MWNPMENKMHENCNDTKTPYVIALIWIYLLFHVAFNSQGHIAMGSL